MRKSGGAVIPMQQNSEISFLVGNEEVLHGIDRVPVLPLFDARVVRFLSALSETLQKDTEARQYGDVLAFAFWLRKAALEQAARRYRSADRVGRGLAFHITPSNIPVQFAVSLVYAWLAGNASVIRVSQRSFAQVDIICRVLQQLISSEFVSLAPYLCIVRFPHDDEMTAQISARADLRLIWGGDRTIAAIQQIPAPPRCLDLGFSDRFSIAVIDADYYLQQDRVAAARDFFLDTYYTDQNACSSSRIVFWIGKEIEKAKAIFWEALLEEVKRNYQLPEISGSEKLLKTALFAEHHEEIREVRQTNALVRVEMKRLYSDVMEYKGNSGYFFEYELSSLDELAPIITKECQTITCYGERLREAIKKMLVRKGVKGGDRIVPMGHSLDLSFVWDGYDLPLVLSRVIAC